MQEEIQCKAKWVAVHKEKLFSTLDSLLQTRFRLLTVWTSAVVSTYGFILLFVWLSFPVKLTSVLLFKSQVGCWLLYFQGL